MKILQLIAQKPLSTGSGTYLTGIMKSLDNLNHKQYMIFGINKGDEATLPLFLNKFVSNPVVYNGGDLDFPIVGMSDKMPYKNTLYKDLTNTMKMDLENVFISKVKEAMDEFSPDLVLIQHLYLVSGKVVKYIKNNYKDIKVFGFSHGTDLRQLNNITETREEIIQDLSYFDKLFFLHEDQINVFNELSKKLIPQSKLTVIGSGFDSKIFNNELKKEYLLSIKDNKNNKKMNEDKIKIVFTGKLCRAKGVYELIDALEMLNKKYPLKLYIIGATGSFDDATYINEKIKLVDYEVEVLGQLSQRDLVKIYSKCDIFTLPSYYEGLPLVVPEAMATGLRACVTNLPGIGQWLNNFSDYIDLIDIPEMENIDTPTEKGRETFINSIANTLEKSIEKLDNEALPNLKEMDWNSLTNRILHEFKN